MVTVLIPGVKLPVQKHVIGRCEIDVPTPDGHHLKRRSGRQVKHEIRDGL